MITAWLCFELESDATFGRGNSIPGLVDHEIAFDVYGCPYLHGRTLKGLLSEVCADLLGVLPPTADGRWLQAADELFGQPGSDLSTQGLLYIGHACLPAGLHQTIRNALTLGTQGWNRDEVIAALTTIRQQTALTSDGAPDAHTLRTGRLILRGTSFEAHLEFHTEEMTKPQKALFGACVKGLRRAGTARNRGRGRLRAWLEDQHHQPLESWYQAFRQEMLQ